MKFGSSSTRIAAGLLGIVLAQPSFAAICHQAATVTVGSSGSGVIQFDTPAATSAAVEYTVRWTSSDGPTFPYFALLDSSGNPAVYGQGTSSHLMIYNGFNNNPDITGATAFSFEDNAGAGYTITGLTISADECTGAAQQSGGGSSGGSPAGSASTASATIIQSDGARVTRSAVTANNSMMSQGLERFIGDRESGMSLTDAISTSGLNSVVVLSLPH